MEMSDLKIFVHLVAECLSGASKVMFIFNNHQATLKYSQTLVSLLFLVSILAFLYGVS